MLSSIAAIGSGAALGALLRWVLGARLNPLLPDFPLGTLAANLLGGYVIGLVLGWLALRPDLPPEVRGRGGEPAGHRPHGVGAHNRGSPLAGVLDADGPGVGNRPLAVRLNGRA
jgi:hypothetical protein